MTKMRSLFMLSVAATILAACGEVREDLGLGRNPPDEFAVVEHPPLSMPPDYGLRPPRPGAPNLTTVNTAQTAKDTLYGAANPQPTDQASSPGEQALLNASGASKASSDIRDTVDRESAQKVVASPHLIDQLTNWSGSGEKPTTTVDAAAEADRIKQDQSSNQPITQGATPVIEKDKSGWLGL